jgi:hypothetical protein
MMDRLTTHLERAKAYTDSREIVLEEEDPIGYGMDGSIWQTSRQSVVKIYEREKNYRDEVECYRRFAAKEVVTIAGFVIPDLIDCDDAILALEMSIVQPPFLLDFGKVYLDSPPPYWDDDEIMGHWHAEGRENFGKQWTKVLSVIRVLEGHGIYYVDPKPGNIMFAD